MTRDVARIGSIAGWILLVGILVLQVAIPSAIAGQALSGVGVGDVEVIRAHFDHPELIPLVALQFLLVLPLVVFAVALREVAARREAARFAATLGLTFMVVEAPLILVQYAMQGTLVALAGSGEPMFATFRAWDLVYNGAVYAVEAGVVVSFGLAVRGHPAFPRWLPPFAVVVGAVQVVNIAGVFGWMPTVLTLPGNVGFAIWLAASAWGLTREARSSTARARTASVAATTAG